MRLFPQISGIRICLSVSLCDSISSSRRIDCGAMFPPDINRKGAVSLQNLSDKYFRLLPPTESRIFGSINKRLTGHHTLFGCPPLPESIPLIVPCLQGVRKQFLGFLTIDRAIERSIIAALFSCQESAKLAPVLILCFRLFGSSKVQRIN